MLKKIQEKNRSISAITQLNIQKPLKFIENVSINDQTETYLASINST